MRGVHANGVTAQRIGRAGWHISLLNNGSEVARGPLLSHAIGDSRGSFSVVETFLSEQGLVAADWKTAGEVITADVAPANAQK